MESKENDETIKRQKLALSTHTTIAAAAADSASRADPLRDPSTAIHRARPILLQRSHSFPPFANARLRSVHRNPMLSASMHDTKIEKKGFCV